MWRQISVRYAGIGALCVALMSVVHAQGTWTWQPQCSSNEWSAICYTHAGCGYDQSNNPVHRYFNNWGHSRCNTAPGLPGPGSICIFPSNANALLNSNVDVLSISISNGATFSWQGSSLTLRNPSDNSPGTLTNAGLLRMVGSVYRSLAGVLVNTGTLVHEAGWTNFNGASVQSSGTIEVRSGAWYNNTGTNSLLNTGTLTKTTTDGFTITVPMQQQNATVNVQAGRLELSGASTHQDVQWSIGEGALLVFSGNTTHTFTGQEVRWDVPSGASLGLSASTHTFTGLYRGEIVAR